MSVMSTVLPTQPSVSSSHALHPFTSTPPPPITTPQIYLPLSSSAQQPLLPPSPIPHPQRSSPLVSNLGENETSDHFQTPAGHLPTQPHAHTWAAAFERQKNEKWRVKVDEDLKGWRGGNGSVHLSPLPRLINEASLLDDLYIRDLLILLLELQQSKQV